MTTKLVNMAAGPQKFLQSTLAPVPNISPDVFIFQKALAILVEHINL